MLRNSQITRLQNSVGIRHVALCVLCTGRYSFWDYLQFTIFKKLCMWLIVLCWVHIWVILLCWDCLQTSLYFTRPPVALGNYMILASKRFSPSLEYNRLPTRFDFLQFDSHAISTSIFLHIFTFSPFSLFTHFYVQPILATSLGACVSCLAIKSLGKVFAQDTSLISVVWQ